jgi:uncharacterized membrane protein YhiD involved in acid resistance
VSSNTVRARDARYSWLVIVIGIACGLGTIAIAVAANAAQGQ